MIEEPKPAATDPQDADSLREFISALEEKYPKYRDALRRERHAAELVAFARGVLRDIREEHAMSQTELAVRIGTTQSRVSAIENGRGDIGLATMLNYFAALRVSPQAGFARLAEKLAQSSD